VNSKSISSRVQNDEFFNPFNAYKSLVHVPRWKKAIEDGIIPYPTYLSVDLAAKCDLDCVWCNSKNIRKQNIHMSVEDIKRTANLLETGFGSAVCVGGGGESLNNPNFGMFIEDTSQHAEIGVITNGVRVHKFLPYFDKCKWVGVSLDCSNKKTFNKLKGKDLFDRVTNNIYSLSKTKCKDIGVKFLIWPGNEDEIFDACRLSKELGADRFQVRPADFSWSMIDNGKTNNLFTEDSVKIVEEQVERCKELRDENFTLHYRTQLFGDKMERKHPFKKCYVSFSNCVIHANGTISLCLDRREDPKTYLCNIKDVLQIWNSEKHKNMLANLKDETCPRCTNLITNQIIENVILEDKMYYNFL